MLLILLLQENSFFSLSFVYPLTPKVSGLVQSTQSLLLEEQGCLTEAKEAQGSIIDLTSQSCRALSPSFTLPACQPHTSAPTYRDTQPPSKDVQALHRDV